MKRRRRLDCALVVRFSAASL